MDLHERLGPTLLEALPDRWFKFEERLRSTEDLQEIYDTEDSQKVKATGHYPDLPATAAVHDPGSFPFTAAVEAATEAIREELFAWGGSTAEQAAMTDEERDDQWTTRFFNGSYGDDFHGVALVRNGEGVEATANLFPRTLALLRAHGVAGGNRLVFFSRQRGHSGIPPHSDCVNYLMTAHLGVCVPDDQAAALESSSAAAASAVAAAKAGGAAATGAPCGMSVGGEAIEWEQGKLVVFQNSFPHFTWNRSGEERILLYFDFWHPDLSEDERSALAIFEDTRREHEQRASMAAQFANPALEDLLKRIHR